MSLSKWLNSFAQAFVEGTFVRIALNKPVSEDELKSIDIKPIVIKQQVKLSFTYHYKTNDLVKNYSFDESKALLTAYLSEKFANGRLFTLKNDWQIIRKNEEHSLHKHAASEKSAPNFNHNRAKNHIIKSDKGWMFGLGLSDSSGKILASAQDKFRQINKYIEIIEGLIPHISQHRILKIIDMGCGKGYLTFALYEHLTQTKNLSVEITGVEIRPELVALSNEIARLSGFTNLKFEQGTIADYDCKNANIIIALHACDTATDDALFKAITAGADLIIAAPCCHKQLRREIESARKTDHDLAFLMRHGIYVEQISEMLTDGFRAQILEERGYKTNVFEFISSSHTPKNRMITALKKEEISDESQTKIRAEIAKTKARFGIKKLYLEDLLSIKT